MQAELSWSWPAPLVQMEGTSFLPLMDATAHDWQTDVSTESWPQGREFATVGSPPGPGVTEP